MIILVLGQTMLASADVHLLFEITDSHHLEHNDDQQALEQHQGDDCEHSCYQHGGCVLLLSDSPASFSSAKASMLSDYNKFYLSYNDKLFLRPPIH
jgi:hypothetical protein